MKKKNSKLKYIALSLLSLAIILPLLLCAVVFSGHPKYQVPELTPEDWAFQVRVVLREMSRIQQAKPGSLAVVTLTPAEVNSLLRTAGNGQQLNALFNPSYRGKAKEFNDFQLSYANGEFDVFYAADTGYKYLFGGYAVLHAKGKVQYQNNAFEINLSQAHAGGLPVSKSLTQQELYKAVEKIDNTPEMQLFRAIVQSVTVLPDNSLKVVYRPDIFRQSFLK